MPGLLEGVIEMVEINAEFDFKKPFIIGERCSIEKLVVLPDGVFEGFKNNVLGDYPFIKENSGIGGMTEGGLVRCFLVCGEGSGEGILVNTEGTSCARYSSFLPDASGIAAACISAGIEQYKEPETEPETEYISMTL